MAFGFGPHNDNFGNGNFAPEPVEREYKSSIMLESLYLHNFKSFYRSKFEFGKLNCLIAPNNTGKSNLIEALKFLDALIYENPARAFAVIGLKNIQNHHHRDSDLMVINAKFHIQNQVLVGDELFDYDIELFFLCNYTFSDKKINIDISISGKIKSVIIDKADSKNGLSLRILDNFSDSIENYKLYDAMLKQTRYKKFEMIYNHNTLSYEILKTNPLNVQESIAKLFGLSIHVKNDSLLKPMDFRLIFNKNSLFASHYFHTHDIKRTQRSGFEGLLEDGTNVVEYLGSLDKDIFEDISISLIGEVELINSIEIKGESIPEVVFNEEVNGKITQVEMKNVSDGTIHFIAIMSAILGNRSSIGLLIEEPERHMHMKVLSYILNTMRDDYKQIFFTTHSGELLKILNQNEIIFMYRDEETGDTKSLNASKIKKLDQIFKKYKYEMTEIIKDSVLGYIGDYDVKE